MNRNCRIASLCIVCDSRCEAIDCFEFARVYIWFDGRFFQTKHEIPVILPVQADLVTQSHCLSSPKAWIIKKSTKCFEYLKACCYISAFVCYFLILLWCTVGQILNVSGHYVKSGVYHLLPAYHDSIKFRIKFWTSGIFWLKF